MTTKNITQFRSISDLKGYCDHEVYDLEKEPSLTDPSQDESIESLVARMLRGEMVGSKTPVFDDIGEGDPFGALPPQEKDGFDISDAGPILEAAAATLADIAPTQSVPPSVAVQPTPAPTPAPADLQQ